MVDTWHQSLPHLRFNKEGNLLAVTASGGGLKVLANADGIKFLRTIEARSYEGPKAPIETKVFFFHSSPSSLSASLTSITFLFYYCLDFDLFNIDELGTCLFCGCKYQSIHLHIIYKT